MATTDSMEGSSETWPDLMTYTVTRGSGHVSAHSSTIGLKISDDPKALVATDMQG
jgi:hypothetical protein